MKKIKKTFLYLLGFSFALFVFAVIINLPIFDEELLPEIQAIKGIKANPFGEDNAYPALIAINGPSGITLKEATKTIRHHLNQQIKEAGIDYLSDDDSKKLIGSGHDDSWRNTYHSCRSRTDLGCMNALVNDLLVNPIVDDRLISQLQRYEALLTFSEYNDARVLKFDSPLIPFGSIMNLQKLYLSNAYIKLNSTAYLTAWQQDQKFWRMVMSKSHLLITKMVAIAAMRTNIDSLSTALKHGAIEPEQLTELQKSVPKLTHANTNFPTTFDYEFKYSMNLIDSAEADEPTASSQWLNFFQPNATHNFTYQHVTRKLKQFSDMNASTFYQLINGSEYEERLESPVPWSPSFLYNPTGKLMVTYGFPAYKDYIGRGHDLIGMMYLLKLQIEIALKPGQAVEQVVADSQYTNPHDLKPMSYNKDKHSIYFECMDKHSVCELSL